MAIFRDGELVVPDQALSCEYDLITLWECVHRYLTAQASVGVADDQAALALTRIGDELRLMHNDLHARYIAPLDAQLADRPISGVS